MSMTLAPEITLAPEPARRGSYVRAILPIIAWAALRMRIEHSQAFRGRYSPENAPWGVEIAESQYWPHVRSVDAVGSPQIGKTFHVCEMTTLYDLVESRETVFYMNGSADNALNIWSSRWLKTLRADPVLRQQLLDRMEAGRWEERHFADGGLLYSAGPESAVALSQKESRIVRCSELEKTKASLGNEASSYSLARDRAAAYPGNHMITSDCTVTVREGLSWIRFAQGDRSRPFIPCASCGHYAVPAYHRHLEEPDLALDMDSAHMLEIPAIATTTPSAAEEFAQLVCKQCGGIFTTQSLRKAIRAVVWVPVGAKVIRRDNPKETPIPKVSWLDDLDTWSKAQLCRPDVIEGDCDPDDPPKWKGPRLPDGVELIWNAPATEADAQTLPGLRVNPLTAAARSFWMWRLFGPKYTIGQVAREIVAGEIGALTGDVIDDQKNVTQKCLVLPWKEEILGGSEDLNEQAVLLTMCDLPARKLPENTAAISAGIDVNEDYIRATKRAWTGDGRTFLLEFIEQATGKGAARDAGVNFAATRTQAIYAALDKVWGRLNAEHPPGMTYIDSSFMSDEIYHWCASKAFNRLRPCKGFGLGGSLGNRRRGTLAGQWNDNCEKRALECKGATGRTLRHQYFDADDPRHLMKLDADHWKKEVHNGIRTASLYHRAKKAKIEDAGLRPWFFIHSGFNVNSPYVVQVVAERWEEWTNPKSGKTEFGWREYTHDYEHALDDEAYAFAAGAFLGAEIGRGIAGRRPLPRSRPRSEKSQGYDPSLG